MDHIRVPRVQHRGQVCVSSCHEPHPVREGVCDFAAIVLSANEKVQVHRLCLGSVEDDGSAGFKLQGAKLHALDTERGDVILAWYHGSIRPQGQLIFICVADCESKR